MARLVSFAGALGLGIAVLLAAPPATAGTVCGTVAEFNAAMVATGGSAQDVTLTFEVVGVNPADFFNTKGSLAQMRNTACNGGEQDAAIKVYGTSEPLNTAHPPGTLKLEYGNACCGGECSEGWADPNASAEIFVDGSESCSVTMWVTPESIGYTLECAAETFDAIGDNTYQNEVDQITLLDYLLPDGGTTWALPNATAMNDEVCYVAVPTGMSTTTVPVAEDVTADPSDPGNVFADVADLAVEADAQEAYLKFDVPPIEGKITQATLFLHTRTESFAEGDGGEVHVVTSQDWSEASLTWNTRPPREGLSLGRIGPAAADSTVSLDLGSVIDEPGLYSFAVVSPPTDGNGTHFFSKEGSASDAAYLRLDYTVVDADADGTPDGPDCDDSNPDANPDAVESCNGIDDDCDGQTDENCPGVADDGSGSGASSSDGSGSGASSSDTVGLGSATTPWDRGAQNDGCACSTRSTASGGWLAFLMLSWLPLRRRGPDRLRIRRP